MQESSCRPFKWSEGSPMNRSIMKEGDRVGRLRRMAERRGMVLRVSNANRRNRYMLIDADTKAIIVGGLPCPYSATLDEVARYLVG